MANRGGFMTQVKSFLRVLVHFTTVSLLLSATPAATVFAQDPSGRPTEPSSKGRKPPVRRNTPARVDAGPITVTLTILSDPPGCSVNVNGEPRGATSAEGKLQIDKLPLGRYTIEVRKDGFNSMSRGFQAGSEAPTLVFKLEPNLEEYVKEFDALIASGKLTGPESPNAFQVVNDLSTKYPTRPEVPRLRGALSAKLAEAITPVINNTVLNWRSVSREDMIRASDRARSALVLKEDDRRVQAEAAYLTGAIALRDWQSSGDAVGEANPTQGGLQTEAQKGSGGATAASATLASARAEFEKALGFEDSFTAARYQLGVVLQASGDSPAAETALVRVTQLEPRWTPAYLALGSAYYSQGKYKEAIEAYRKATELAPNQSAAVAGLGLARVAKGEKDGIKDIERAMQLDPASGLPHLNLGIAYSLSKSKKDLARAEEEFKKAIAKNTANLEFSNRKAERLLSDLQKRKK
jgi:tetratricopeptide (TPR) repeat protein